MKFIDSRISEIENLWCQLNNQSKYLFNPPLNQYEEFQKVIEFYRDGKIYNPQFIYSQISDYDTNQIGKFISKLEPENSFIEQLYYEKAINLLDLIEGMQSRHGAIITKTSARVYGYPTYKLVEQAYKILTKTSHNTKINVPSIPIESVIIYLKEILVRLGLENWVIQTKETIDSQTAVDFTTQVIKLHRHSKYWKQDIYRLLLHEVGCNIFRYENGVRQPLKLFSSSFPNHLATEKGLAIFNESKYNVLFDKTLRKYAWHTIAIHLALTHSFSEIFHQLVPEFGELIAFEIASGAKRGFTDTSLPGAYTKNIVYLQGYFSVKEYITNYPEAYILLFCGKIGLNDIFITNKLLELGEINHPHYTPEMLNDVFTDSNFILYDNQ